MHGDPGSDTREHRRLSVSVSRVERVPAVTPEGVPFAILTWPWKCPSSFCLCLAGSGMPVLLHDTQKVYVWPTSLWASVSHLGSGISGALSSDEDTEKPCDSCVCPGQIAQLPFFQSFTRRFAVLSPGSRIPIQLALARRVQLGKSVSAHVGGAASSRGYGGAVLPWRRHP